MSDKILTVIIPTYNMSKYLNRCLDSLLVDSDSLEVLVINDGSKDNSSEIAHTYQDKYPNIFKVIDKENGNYGSCINRGLEEATGKYVKILDSDDYFDNNQFLAYLKSLGNTDVDLILTDFNVVFNDSDKKIPVSFDFKPGVVLPMEEICNTPAFNRMEMHAITYKLTVIKSLNYVQTERISYTDQEWIFTPMAAVDSVLYLQNNVYQYVMGREGQTVDESSYIKNIKHLVKVAVYQTETYNKLKISLSAPKRTYLHTKLMMTLGNVYRRFLLKEGYPFAEIKPFDEAVKSADADVYAELDKVSLYGFHNYIQHYHQTGKPSSWCIRKIYQCGKKWLS